MSRTTTRLGPLVDVITQLAAGDTWKDATQFLTHEGRIELRNILQAEVDLNGHVANFAIVVRRAMTYLMQRIDTLEQNATHAPDRVVAEIARDTGHVIDITTRRRIATRQAIRDNPDGLMTWLKSQGIEVLPGRPVPDTLVEAYLSTILGEATP